MVESFVILLLFCKESLYVMSRLIFLVFKKQPTNNLSTDPNPVHGVPVIPDCSPNIVPTQTKKEYSKILKLITILKDTVFR